LFVVLHRIFIAAFFGFIVGLPAPKLEGSYLSTGDEKTTGLKI